MAKEPLIRALRGERVEQIPWLPHIGTHAAQLLDVSAERYLQDAELLARGAILCADHYRCDGIPLLDDPQMEAIALGCLVHWSKQGPPSIVSSPLYGLSPEQVVAQLPPLPDETTGRWPSVIAYQLRGMALFRDLFRHPECAARLFAYAGQVSAISARIYAEVIGCDIVAINDTPATMLQPAYFRQYVIPNLQPAWQVIHRAGKTSSFWA